MTFTEIDTVLQFSIHPFLVKDLSPIVFFCANSQNLLSSHDTFLLFINVKLKSSTRISVSIHKLILSSCLDWTFLLHFVSLRQGQTCNVIFAKLPVCLSWEYLGIFSILIISETMLFPAIGYLELRQVLLLFHYHFAVTWFYFQLTFCILMFSL